MEPATSGRPETLTKADLVAFLASGCKPRDQWRIGTEHEKLAFSAATGRRLTYEQIAALLTLMQRKYGGEPITERGRIIGLVMEERRTITLEPGGQIELGGAAVESLHEVHAELVAHLAQLQAASDELGLGVVFLGAGCDPKWLPPDVPHMPKQRYEFLDAPLATRSPLGTSMMYCSCTTQVNLDFESEADMVQKARIALALQPVATALLANSPFRGGKPTGYLSYRAHSWMGVEPIRCGNLPFAHEAGFGFERYVDFALQAPLYFVAGRGRGEELVDVQGQPFLAFMEGKLPGLPGVHATLTDWKQHLGTLWPDVRLKPACLEMRGADCGPWPAVCALPALWVGLLYDAEAQAQAAHLVADWSQEERDTLLEQVPRLALHTPFRGCTVQDLAKQVLRIARGGLERRGRGEECYLRPLEAIAETGQTQAERLLALYAGQWGGSIEPMFGSAGQFTTSGRGAFEAEECPCPPLGSMDLPQEAYGLQLPQPEVEADVGRVLARTTAAASQVAVQADCEPGGQGVQPCPHHG